MPLYEYLCEACGHRFETIRKFSDPPIETCPRCGGAVNKLQSAPAFHLKGSGWYVTDYARKDAAAEHKDAPAAEGKSEGKPEGKAEGKTEGKTEGKPESNAAAKADTKTEAKTETKPATAASETRKSAKD